ncbi:MAG TPA: DegQ family serine endoprotease [Rudaea sp.]
MTRPFAALAVAALVAAFAQPLPCSAALPPAVDGQALPSLAPMLEKVTPGVVNINSKTKVRVRNPLMDDPFFRQFFGMQDAPRERIEQSLGSGVIIDAGKGYVLTNNHVVEGADDISVTLHDGRNLKAKLIGNDPDTDIAVIQIPAESLTALPLADSSQLRVGDFVVAVGNPFGVGQSASSGIVSGLNRTGLGGRGIQNFIQTDASINPGNSGGALVNLRGELVGINSQIFSTSGGSIGIGFAIPANLARDVMHQLIATGTVKHGTLGVQVQTLTPEIAHMLETQQGQGAVVTAVGAGSAAEEAGLKAGDIVIAVNGKAIANENDLYNAEGLAPIGSTLELTLLRDGKKLTLPVRLVAESVASSDGAKVDARLAGAELLESSERMRRTLREAGIDANGVAVARVAPNSRAAKNGLKAGDLIVGVNRVGIDNLNEMRTLIARSPRSLLLSVVRGRSAFFLPLQ